MIKEQDTMAFAYDITVWIHSIVISTASNIIFKAQVVSDIMVCIHIIMKTSSNIMMKAQDIKKNLLNSKNAVTRRQ